MIKINFICHGNICRSTMAESVMTHLIKQNGLENKFNIKSSATSCEEIGNPPHQGTQTILKKNNIKVIDHRATQITKEDAKMADFLVCMDSNNINNLKKIINKEDQRKISLLLSWANEERAIADPWYTLNYETTFEDVYKGCYSFLEYLKNQ